MLVLVGVRRLLSLLGLQKESITCKLTSPGHACVCLCLQDERMRLERDKADMTFALQRSSTDKDQEVVAAKAAASIAEGKLQSLLEELSNAKHTSEAASTTSGFVLKVCGSRGVHPEHWLRQSTGLAVQMHTAAAVWRMSGQPTLPDQPCCPKLHAMCRR